MYARFDFMSPETGRVLLSTLFDAPQDRLPHKHISGMLRTLKATKKQLESIFGEGMVRLSLDNYEASVFWAIVLFRPLTVYGERQSVYDILLNGDPLTLQKSNLGIIYEPEHGFLVLDWKEAKKGVLQDLIKCPSWELIMKNAWKRNKKFVGRPYWKRCAESHSWVVPEWVLAKMGFLRDRVWFRPTLTYDDITVLDTRGIEVIRLEGEGKGALNEAKLMTAKNVKFVHHYTTADKREFRAAYHLQKQQEKDPAAEAAKRRQRTERQNLRRKGIEIPGSKKDWKRREFETENRKWYLASRVVGQLPKYLGKGFRGKYPALMTPDESNVRFEYVLNAYINGELEKVKWKRVHSLLKELEDLLPDPRVPNEFGDWLVWRDKGKHVPAYLARRDNELGSSS